MATRATLAALLCVLCLPASSSAHAPNTDGGAAQRSCGVIGGVSAYGPVGVGATRVRCRVGRRVAKRSVENRRVKRWRCTGRGTRFGHCHRRGTRARVIVHWYAYH